MSQTCLGQPIPKASIRLLALDVDGTILGPSGQIDPLVMSSLHQAMDSGIRIVLCTGRRFRRASAVASKIGLDSPMVCNSGALVKCPSTNKTFWRADHEPENAQQIIEIFDRLKRPILSFLDLSLNDPDFITSKYPSGCHLFDQYLDENQGLGQIDPHWRQSESVFNGHFHLCAAGSHDEMLNVEQELERLRPGAYQIFVQKSPNYKAWMCEVLRRDANKWTALKTIADDWGIAGHEICAVGDDANDIPMILQAGWGVAMGHSAEFVKKNADWIAPDNAHHGVADVVRILLERQQR
jgi:5-amino-6-(5-phospho-D-ribitylamino)uracil phosphatase